MSTPTKESVDAAVLALELVEAAAVRIHGRKGEHWWLATVAAGDARKLALAPQAPAPSDAAAGAEPICWLSGLTDRIPEDKHSSIFVVVDGPGQEKHCDPNFPVYSAAQLAAAEAKGYERGFKDGMASRTRLAKEG